jgi:hypothetical protein
LRLERKGYPDRFSRSVTSFQGYNAGIANDIPLPFPYLLSAHQEKIPARNAIYAHAQDFSAGDELLLAILKAFIPQPLNNQQTKVFHVF